MTEIPLGYRPDTLGLFERLLDLPRPALLHSADRSNPQGRYDVVAADPYAWIHYDGARLHRDGTATPAADPLAALRAALPPVGGPVGAHFRHGFIGYFAYDLCHPALGVTSQPPTSVDAPPLQGGLYAWSIVTDHWRRQTTLFAHGVSRDYVRGVVACVDRAAPRIGAYRLAPFTQPPEDDYRTAFARIQEYLHAGDCYQVNLARHFHAACVAPAPADTFALYRQLVARQPGAFAAFLDMPGTTVLSLSPERLLQFGADRIETCPIKGTASRGADPDEDRRLAVALRSDSKNRAENLMIVDLLRNDLGRVCRAGSIRVTKMFELLALDNVHHLVSTIEGTPRSGVDALEALAALFPGGSVTGAPKRRAMEIIAELEPAGRSVYCGSIGYLDASGLMDASVAIRTLVHEHDVLHCWGGGAIVAESECAAELHEIELKIGRLLQTVDASVSRRSSSA
jgi:para-aminobenzoate synthetase component I